MELQTITIQGGQPGPRLLITAGVHGDELEPVAAVQTLIRTIDRRTLRGQLTLVPCVNEAAFNRNSRAAEDGLDLARICPGAEIGTISTQTAFAVSKLIRSSDYYIDLHTGGVLFRLWPLAGYMLHADSDIRATQQRMARAFGMPLVWATSAALNGRTLSVARDCSIPAIYAEFGGGGTFDQSAVDAYVVGCKNVMAEIGSLSAGEPPFSAQQQIVEDGRDRAGVLQIQHPSPVDGFFEPAVELGQTITAGASIGSVVGILGEIRADVRAADSGLVVMLRAWRHVSIGDALVAIASSTDSGER